MACCGNLKSIFVDPIFRRAPFQIWLATMDEQNIVKNIKTIRQTQKISLERLAKMTGLTKGYLSKIENSPKAPPFLDIDQDCLCP